MSEFDLKTEKTADGTVVRIAGDLDMAVSPTLRDALYKLYDEKPGRIIVDMRGVTMMDSSGIAVLIEALRCCRKKKLGLALSSPSDPVRKVLELARLNEGVFEILNP